MTGYAQQIHPWLSWHRNFLFLWVFLKTNLVLHKIAQSLHI
jgi:hypothetical protein